MTQHTTLDADRWARFTVDQQVLMIGNEMNRATRFLGEADRDGLRRGYERVLRLTDLTLGGSLRPTLLRELLRWRDLAAYLYSAEQADPEAHRAAFRALLQLRPIAAKQIPFLLG